MNVQNFLALIGGEVMVESVSGNSGDICKCDCHKGIPIHDFSDCCDGPCSICGLNIKSGQMIEHKKRCEQGVVKTTK